MCIRDRSQAHTEKPRVQISSSKSANICRLAYFHANAFRDCLKIRSSVASGAAANSVKRAPPTR